MEFIKLDKTSVNDKNNPLLQQAQNIWSMLDEMASSDQNSYKKFIQKTLEEGKEAMKLPEAHMCVKTKLLRPKNCNLFINFFGWNRIPEPKTKSDSIPIFGKELEFEENVSYINIAFNSNFLKSHGNNGNIKEEVEMLIQLAFEFIENQNGCEIDKFDYNILNSKIYGDLNKNLLNLTNKQANSDLSIVNDHLRSMGIDEKHLSENILSKLISIGDENKYQDSPKKNLIQEMEEKHLPIYEEKITQDKLNVKHYALEFRVDLPKISSINECDIDMTDDQIVIQASNYKNLKIPLNSYFKEYLVETEKTEAKFIKSKLCLKIKIPLVVKN